MMTQPTVAVLMACFNRRSQTLQCLASLARQRLPEGVRCQVFLVDDGSTDGTGQAVAEAFPAVRVVRGDGTLYWNRGMHLAFQTAMAEGYDYYTWLNDDVCLTDDAFGTLLRTHQELAREGLPESIVVGSVQDPSTGLLSYGGYALARGWFSWKVGMVQPTEQRQECETMCGNCVLIPAAVVARIGPIDPVFHHRWGDADYGLRARRHGCRVWVAPGYVGTCEDNPKAEAWRDARLPFWQRIKELHSIKGLHKEDWWTYVRRHGGGLWVLNGLRPYASIALGSARHALQGTPREKSQKKFA